MTFWQLLVEHVYSVVAIGWCLLHCCAFLCAQNSTVLSSVSRVGGDAHITKRVMLAGQSWCLEEVQTGHGMESLATRWSQDCFQPQQLTKNILLMRRGWRYLGMPEKTNYCILLDTHYVFYSCQKRWTSEYLGCVCWYDASALLPLIASCVSSVKLTLSSTLE